MSARWILAVALFHQGDFAAGDRGLIVPRGYRRWKPAVLFPGWRARMGRTSPPPRRMPMTPGSPVSPRAPKSCRPAHPGDDRIPNRDAKWRSSRKHFHQSFGLDRSCRPPLLLSFWDGKRLRKTATDFKPAPKKILTFSNPCSHPTDFGGGRPNPGFTKKKHKPLETEKAFVGFLRAAIHGPGASRGPG